MAKRRGGFLGDLSRGLAQVAAGTTEIRTKNLRQRELDLEAQKMQAALDEVDRQRKLSDLLSQRYLELPGNSEVTTRPYMRGAMQTERTPTPDAALLSELIRGTLPGDRVALYEKLFPGPGREATDALERDLLEGRISLEEYRKKRLEGYPSQARPEKTLAEKNAEYRAEVGAEKQRNLSGLNILEQTPERQAQAEMQAKSDLAAVSGVDVPGNIPTVEPATAQEAIRRADRFGAGIVNMALPPLNPKDRGFDRRTKERTELALQIKHSPAYQKLISLQGQAFDDESQNVVVQGIRYFIPDYVPKRTGFGGLIDRITGQ